MNLNKYLNQIQKYQVLGLTKNSKDKSGYSFFAVNVQLAENLSSKIVCSELEKIQH